MTVLAAPAWAAGGDDHTHGDEPTVAARTAAPRVVATSDAFELVGVLQPDGLSVWLDRPDSNEPVTAATVTADVDGKTLTATPDESGGSYALAGDWAERPGTHEFVFTVTLGDEADLLAGSLDVAAPADGHAHHWPEYLAVAAGVAALALFAAFLLRRRGAATAAAALLLLGAGTAAPPVRAAGGDDHVHADEAAAPATGGVQLGVPDAAARLPNGSLFVPKPLQRLLEVRTAVFGESTAAGSVRLIGRVIADPDRSGIVQATGPGRLLPPPGGFPRLGAPVRRGEVLAYHEPALSGGDRLAWASARVELDSAIEIAGRRVERLERLRETVAAREIEDAKTGLAALKRRRADLEQGAARLEPLRAPVDGVVARSIAAAGRVVDAPEVVFEVAAAGAFWVEAAAVNAATVAAPATARLADGRVLRLEPVGAGSSSEDQAVIVRFRVVEAPPGLTLHAPVVVHAAQPGQRGGIVVPRAALVESTAGTPLVWVKVAPETFAPRDVRVEDLGGDDVLVVAGLKAPARVVVRGAQLINQVR